MSDRRQFIKAAMAVGATPMLSGLAAQTAAAPVMKRSIIIDTDPGVDDAFAIMMALRTPELRIEAVIAVAGNVPLAKTSVNALNLIGLSGRTDIPVIRGASAPIARDLQVATYAHGENGLLGVELPKANISFSPDSASETYARIVRANPGKITIVAVGPLTNVALALREDPALASQIEQIILMGGGKNMGNMTPAAEFNFYVDPEAAAIVFASGIPITMVGLNATEQVNFTDAQLNELRKADSPISRAAAEISSRALDNAAKRGGQRTFHIHDALALSVLLDPAVVKLEDYYVRIETAGEFTAGESLCYKQMPMRASAPSKSHVQGTSAESKPPRMTHVAVDANSDLFCDLLVSRLAH